MSVYVFTFLAVWALLLTSVRPAAVRVLGGRVEGTVACLSYCLTGTEKRRKRQSSLFIFG